MPIRPIFLLVLAIAAVPSIAQAHAILEESTPPSGASVKPGPLELRFRYNSRIDHARSRLTLIRPDRTKDTIPIAAEAPPDIIDAHVELSPGAYVIRWQVLAPSLSRRPPRQSLQRRPERWTCSSMSSATSPLSSTD